MQFVEFRTVHIVCDFILKDHVLRDVLALGASGYTWGEAQGAGEHDFVGDTYTGPDRVWVDVWCNQELAEKIVAHFQHEGFRDLALVIGVQPILVPQKDAHKFTKRHRS